MVTRNETRVEKKNDKMSRKCNWAGIFFLSFGVDVWCAIFELYLRLTAIVSSLPIGVVCARGRIQKVPYIPSLTFITPSNFLCSLLIFAQRPFSQWSVDLCIVVVVGGGIWMREISTSISGLFGLRIKQAECKCCVCRCVVLNCDLKSIAKTYTFFSLSLSFFIEIS